MPEKELAELIFQNATCFYSLILVPKPLLMAEVCPIPKHYMNRQLTDLRVEVQLVCLSIS